MTDKTDKDNTPETNSYDDQAIRRVRDLLQSTPESVGPYRILERIGGGGMGEVFHAEQRSPIRREVALKFIKLGMDTKQVIARFEAERQALAMMDHPHIAKVYDAGTDDTGRPYFVMEYVKGKPITEYADINLLSIEDRMSLFEQVCQAVQHAHHKGVIHRDLKPGNVLVSTQDGRAFSKVIDFGIAKAISQRLTDLTLFTQFDQFIGTPQYMSPEQAEGSLDIDTRSDVYSLGVLLYELLTGSTPFTREDFKAIALEQLKRLIIEIDPPKPSTKISSIADSVAPSVALRSAKEASATEDPFNSRGATIDSGAKDSRFFRGAKGDNASSLLTSLAKARSLTPQTYVKKLRGELDWIVMKALEKDRKRRYATPSQLADDVQAYLQGAPIEAAPPSTAYRVSKFVRKNKGKLVAASLLFTTLILGMFGTSWGLFRAEREATIARQQTERATEARDEAEKARIAETKQREQAENRKAELERQTYRLGLQTAYNSLEAGELDAANATLKSLPEHLRGWEWRWLLAETDSALSSVIIPPGKKILAHSRNGSYTVLADDDQPNGPFEIIQSWDGAVVDRVVVPEVESVLGVCLSCDGRKCAILAINQSDKEKGLRSAVYLWDSSLRKISWNRASERLSTGYLFTTIGDDFAISDDGSKIRVGMSEDSIALALRRQAPEFEPLFNHATGGIIFDVNEASEEVAIKTDAKMSPTGRFVSEMTYRANQEMNSQYGVIGFRDLHAQDGLPRIVGEVPSVHIIYVTDSRVCLKHPTKGWELFDLVENKLLYRLGFGGQYDKINWYSDGECGVRINEQTLEYFISGHEGSSWKLGYVPKGVTELFCDERNQRLYAIGADRIYSYPLPSRPQVMVLASLGGNSLSRAGRVIGRSRMLDTLALVRNATSWSRSHSFVDNDSAIIELSQSGKQLRTRELESNKLLSQLELPFEDSVDEFLHSQDFSRIALLSSTYKLSIPNWGDYHKLKVINTEDGYVIWSGGYTAAEVELLRLERSNLNLLAERKLESIDVISNKHSLPLGNRKIDCAAFALNGSNLATLTGNVVSIWDATFSPVSSWTIPHGNSYSIHWTQDDNRVIVLGERFACICDPRLAVVLLSLTIGDDNCSIPNSGDTMLLDGKLCSSFQFSERWQKWDKTLQHEFDPGEINAGLQAVLQCLETTEQSFEEIGEITAHCVRRLLDNVSLTVTRKSHALRMLYEAERELESPEFAKIHGLSQALLEFCQSQKDDQSRFLFRDVLVELAKRLAPSADKLNSIAWEIVNRPEASQTDYASGLELAIEASRKQPDSAYILNTLGVAYYRVERFEECISILATLNGSIGDQETNVPSNQIFMAMAHAKLGDAAKANALFDEVVKRAESKPLDSEDVGFLKEAKKVLGIE